MYGGDRSRKDSLINFGFRLPSAYDNRPLVIGGTGVISVIYACDEAGLSLGFITSLCQKLPLYSMGFCWVSVSLVMLVISLAIGFIKSRKKPKKA